MRAGELRHFCEEISRINRSHCVRRRVLNQNGQSVFSEEQPAEDRTALPESTSFSSVTKRLAFSIAADCVIAVGGNNG